MKNFIFYLLIFKSFLFFTDTLQAQVTEEEPEPVIESMIDMEVPTRPNAPNSTQLSKENRVAPKKAFQGQVGGRYGFYKGNDWLVPPEYDKLPKEYSDFMIAQKNNKYGIIDRLNNVILPFEFDKFLPIYKDFKNWRDREWSGYYSATKNGKSGIYNQKGKATIPLEYETVSKLKEGLYCVGSKGSGYGVLTIEGKEVLPIEYENSLYMVNDKYLQTEKDGKYGWIDFEGVTILPFEYEEINLYNYPTTHWMFKKKGKWGIMDNDFQVVLEPRYDSMRKRNGFLHVKLGEKVGFYNRKFKLIVPIEYKEIEFLSRSLFKVRAGDFGQYGVIDSLGNLLLKPEYRYVQSVNDKIIFANRSREYYAVFDRKGKEITPPTYSSIRVRYPYAIAQKEYEGKYGLINDNGKEITPFIYDKIEVQKKGRNRPMTITAERDGLKGSINLDGSEGPNFQPKGEDPAITRAREEKAKNAKVLNQLRGEWYGLEKINGQEYLCNVSFLSSDSGIRTIYYLEGDAVCSTEQYFLPKLLGSMGGSRTLVGQLQSRSINAKCAVPNATFQALQQRLIFNQMLHVESKGFGRGLTLRGYFKKESPAHVSDPLATLVKIKEFLKLADELSRKVETRPGGLKQYPKFNISANGTISLKRDIENDVFGKIVKDGVNYVFETEHWMIDANYSLAGIWRNVTYKDANGNIKTGDLDICFLATNQQKFWFKELAK